MYQQCLLHSNSCIEITVKIENSFNFCKIVGGAVCLEIFFQTHFIPIDQQR